MCEIHKIMEEREKLARSNFDKYFYRLLKAEIRINKMHADEYHKIPALSQSTIKTILQKSALHAWLDSPLNPDRVINKPTAAMMDGTAAHSLILEGVDLLTIIDADSYRTKSAQEARDEAIFNGRIPKLADKAAPFYAMCATAREQIQNGLEIDLEAGGRAEATLTWDSNGLACKGRLDWLSAGLILDLKITELSQSSFSRSIGQSGYDVQSEFYKEGVEKVFGADSRFIFCVVDISQENITPVSFLELSPAFCEIARAKIARAKQIWKACTESNIFTCYDTSIQRVEPMPWLLAEAEELRYETDGFSVEAFLFGSVGEKVNKYKK